MAIILQNAAQCSLGYEVSYCEKVGVPTSVLIYTEKTILHLCNGDELVGGRRCRYKRLLCKDMLACFQACFGQLEMITWGCADND